MTAAITMRDFRPGDIDAVAAAVNASARQAYAFFGWDYPVSVTKQRLLDKGPEWTYQRVAVADGIPVGWLALTPNFIDQIFVAPEWQGKGAGRKFMAEAKRVHADFLELDCAAENRLARRFYEHHGFTAIRHGIHETMGFAEVTYRWQP
jgi:putative acetyltransferase